MITLSLFLEENDRLFSLKPFRSCFNPYFRLQAIRRVIIIFLILIFFKILDGFRKCIFKRW